MAAASCPPAYDWAKNSQGMDPCAVASNLIRVCDIGPLTPIPPNTSYPPPTRESQTMCTCSGPVYALISACADCQGGAFGPWRVWSHQCSDVFERFSQDPGTMIPTWASHFNIRMDLTYDPISAQALASSSQPQSTSMTTSTATSTSTLIAFSTTSAVPSLSKADTTASPSSFSVSPNNIPFGKDTSTAASQDPTAILGANQPTDQASSGSLKKSNDTGAIAGGVVGGMVFLVAIAAFFLWWLQHRRKLRTAPSAAYIAAYGTARPPTSNSFRPGPFDERAGSPHAYSNSRAERYRDDDRSASTYLGGTLQQTTHYSNVAPESGLGGSRES